MASLNDCRRELRSIVNELRSIEAGVRHDFVGIGEDICADTIGKIADKYNRVLNRLYSVDYNRLASWIIDDER